MQNDGLFSYKEIEVTVTMLQEGTRIHSRNFIKNREHQHKLHLHADLRQGLDATVASEDRTSKAYTGWKVRGISAIDHGSLS
jgi:hypothetical protein